MNKDHVTRARRYVKEWAPLLGISRPISVELSSTLEDQELKDTYAALDDFSDSYRVLLNEDMSIQHLLCKFRMGLEELVVHELLHSITSPVETRVLRSTATLKQKSEINWAFEQAIDEIARTLVRTKRHFRRKRRVV